MFTVIIIMIIGLIISIRDAIQDGFELKEDFDIYVLSAVAGLFFGSILGVALAFLIPTKTEKIIESYNLVSLQDNNSLNGHFFLGSGYINGSMKYVFYYQTDDGYRMEQLNYDEALIKNTLQKPIFEIHKEQKKDVFINNFSFYLSSLRTTNVLYVPKGTIKENYNLDSQ